MKEMIRLLWIGVLTALFARNLKGTCNDDFIYLAPNDQLKAVVDVGAQNFIRANSKHMAQGYTTPDGRPQSSMLLALQTAEQLRSAGRRVSIISFQSNTPLRPLRYEGRVEFNSYPVAVSDGWVYDSMIGEPVRLGDYSQRAFGLDIPYDLAFKRTP